MLVVVVQIVQLRLQIITLIIINNIICILNKIITTSRKHIIHLI